MPCTIDDPPADDCQRVKFGLVLYRDAVTHAPTTCLMSRAPDGLDAYWPIGDDILFILDERLMPRVGDAAYGSALNSLPLGTWNHAPE